jgi:hypothetical protein
MDLAHANARGVSHVPGSIRKSGSRYTVRTLSSPYLAELGNAVPTAATSGAWLSAC